MMIIEQASRAEMHTIYYNKLPEMKDLYKNKMNLYAIQDNKYYALKRDSEGEPLPVFEFDNINDCFKYLEGKLDPESIEYRKYLEAKKEDSTLLCYTDYIRNPKLYDK